MPWSSSNSTQRDYRAVFGCRKAISQRHRPSSEGQGVDPGETEGKCLISEDAWRRKATVRKIKLRNETLMDRQIERAANSEGRNGLEEEMPAMKAWRRSMIVGMD